MLKLDEMLNRTVVAVFATHASLINQIIGKILICTVLTTGQTPEM